MQLIQVVGTDLTLHPCYYGGVTAGHERHNSSNVGCVPACQVRHNSSVYNVVLYNTRYSDIMPHVVQLCSRTRWSGLFQRVYNYVHLAITGYFI